MILSCASRASDQLHVKAASAVHLFFLCTTIWRAILAKLLQVLVLKIFMLPTA